MLELVILGIGSNAGVRMQNIHKAVESLYFLHGFDILATSSIYETEPWGFKNQNNFLNCVLAGVYRQSPEKLFMEIKEIENKIGRIEGEKWHSREIDIDILFYGRRIIKTKEITIPHPWIQFRNFVLKPLADIVPDFVHPVLRKKIISIYNSSADKGKVKIYKDSGRSVTGRVKHSKSR